MRMNTPVTDTEYLLKDGLSIVSKTDLKGRITYVNPYFTEASGYEADELLGKAHNLVRHPDMPPEAFADLWRTLEAGLPWSGLVKNRRKNGDFYWVQANVTPVREGERVVGYLSVRTKPNRDAVAAAEALYRRMRAGQADDVRLHRGKIIRRGLGGIVDRMRAMPFAQWMAIKMSALCLLVLALGGVGLAGQAQQAGGMTWWVAGLTAVILGALLSGWYSLHTMIVPPVRDAIRTARALAGGDLTNNFDVSRNGELGDLARALQQMNVNLQATIADVHANVESITRGAQEIASGNQGLANRTQAQAASLEQTAVSMGQIASAVKQNVHRSEQANQLGRTAAEVATKGGKVVEQVVVTMDEISTASRKVVDIVSLINGIAFQTNLLALNAAVEAARAGEQGRGFAVVAGEVRSLAQRCSVAAKEIKDLIDVAVEKVDTGTELVHDAGATMEELLVSVRSVTAIMDETTAASVEQGSGIEQINCAVVDMDEATQQNAALVEQAAAAAASLAEEAQHLAQSVALFRLAGVQARQGGAVVRQLPAKSRTTDSTPLTTRARRA